MNELPKLISEDLPNWADALMALLSIVTLVAVSLAAIQIRNLNQQMHRELEMQYLLRFWALMDQLSKRHKLGGRPSRGDRAVFREYLGLSEDQIELRSVGRVTDHTWSYWRIDIRSMCLSDSIYREILSSPTTQYSQLRRLLVDPSFDPLEKGRSWRLLKGL
ncbi:hypothetical protein [Leucobacter japonicus]|uniref:hypothetical protein n=1 Tax=Leucobacter japonicus TaxID=1461259 RepID=UPI0012E1A5C4|nr:hypothetical protein [Leucobacter japonicus]